MQTNNPPPSTLRFLKSQTDPLVHLFKPGVPNFWFRKPSPGNGVEILHANDGMEQLRIVKLSLRDRGCIPFHRHKSKEKMYSVCRQDTPFTVYLGIIDPVTGSTSVHTLFPDCTFVVPRNHWHCIWVTSDKDINDCLLVVSSSQDGDDIEWAPEGNILVRLTQKAERDCQDETPLQANFDSLIARIEDSLDDD